MHYILKSVPWSDKFGCVGVLNTALDFEYADQVLILVQPLSSYVASVPVSSANWGQYLPERDARAKEVANVKVFAYLSGKKNSKVIFKAQTLV